MAMYTLVYSMTWRRGYRVSSLPSIRAIRLSAGYVVPTGGKRSVPVIAAWLSIENADWEPCGCGTLAREHRGCSSLLVGVCEQVTCLRLAPTRGEAEDEEVFGSTGAFPGVVAASRHINCVRRGFDVEMSMLIERCKCQRQLISSVWTATERCR